MQQYQFPQGFLWGAAASGPQTEGVTNKRHRSIWDSWFAEQPERFYQQVGPQTVCDTYHQYPQDVALMKQTGFNSFRTSIQWSRLIADLETGAPDPDAVRFYHAYLDEMIANGIEPMINLYHFDMPEALQKQYGGFESAHVAELFARMITALIAMKLVSFPLACFCDPAAWVGAALFTGFSWLSVKKKLRASLLPEDTSSSSEAK